MINEATYLISGVAALVLSFGLTLLVRRIAFRYGAIDRPSAAPERKIHAAPTPLLGGWGIFLSLAIMASILAIAPIGWFEGYLHLKHILGVLGGGLLLMIGGTFDDVRSQRPASQLIWPVLAAAVIVASGIGMDVITNPLGGTIDLTGVRLTLFTLNDLPYSIVLWADLFTFIWLMGMMFTTKFLDGLDGLSSGVTLIGMVILFILSVSKTVAQPETGLLAAVIAGSLAGFLLLNWNPAKIFLGQGGSLLCGYLLGVVALISGGKIATALLIMGIPILDVAWVILRRAFIERVPITSADKKHLHYRLLDFGLTPQQVVLLLFLLTALFGIAGLTLQHREKVWALLGVFSIMLLLAIIVVRHTRKSSFHERSK